MITLFVLVLPVLCDAGELPSPAVGEIATADPLFDEAARRLGYLSDVGRYDDAWALCDSLRIAFPDQPAPFLNTAIVYVNWMQSYRLSDYESEVDENVKQAIDNGTRLLKTSDDPWLSFHVGSAYGYRAMARFRRHNWIGAFLDGKRSNEHLRRALARDPKLYDVYFALGAYHYWRTARSGFLRAVAFWMPDKRDLGLQQMELASRHGRYIRHGAMHGLALSLYDAGEIEAALAVNQQVMDRIDPSTNGSTFMRGRLLARQESWVEVEKTFRGLQARLPAAAVGYQVECKYWIARALQGQQRTDEARQLVREALELSKSRDEKHELESALESFATIRKQLMSLSEQLQ
ncbi:MAG: hypothetical protein HOM68_10425 [Gemmatimonadetes bacterium]|jgi:tetratricopeptide (TPR) repeat protein|nr:hypothetical protein [Gemmatimonadota bacterium]MBT4612412.1 hypothetical protein [Gemmatimonadota bacterium]MBT5056943.1 hypothetical protein [Gemmatimonadota bacterium]MBT5142196.1 hypothetical protein [Gemmatimonadota bacterium]MBT5589219.1 hypothetical protein [Gemmatimonadota bacterium]